MTALSEDYEEFEDDDSDDSDDWEDEDAMEDCHGWFDAGVFVCGAVGSEQCDECTCNAWLGLTNEQIDEMEFRE